jgi:hypothetical protein
MSELTWADLIACVDGLTAPKKTLAERVGERSAQGRASACDGCEQRVKLGVDVLDEDLGEDSRCA